MSVFIKSSTFANVNHKQHYNRNNMIDDKKIEEAAKSLRKDFNDDVTQGFLVEFGFEKGAKWAITEFLKGSWHSIEEKPEKEKTFLYQTSFGGFGLNQISDKKDWDFIKKYQKATQWLYVEKLLQKEGDNHD